MRPIIILGLHDGAVSLIDTNIKDITIEVRDYDFGSVVEQNREANPDVELHEDENGKYVLT